MSENNSTAELKKAIAIKDETIASLNADLKKLSQAHDEVLASKEATQPIEKHPQNNDIQLFTARQSAALSRKELEIERDFMRTTMSSLREAVIVTDLGGIIRFCNPAGHQLLGTQEGSLRNKQLQDVLLITTDESIPVDLINSHIENNKLEHQIGFFKPPLGEQIIIEWSSNLILNKKNQPQGIVFTVKDVTDAHHLKNQLTHQATHDALTGLINRLEFDRRLKNCLSSLHNRHIKHGLIYIDLDQFKIVNDTCGHQAGDQLLRQLSSLITSKIRGRDTLARLGGDEFAVLLENCPPNVIRKVAEELLKIIQDYRFSWENKVFDVGASIGIAIFSSSNHKDNDPLSTADTARYKAKENGRNQIHEIVISDDQTETDHSHAEVSWIKRINQSLEQNKLILYQQKIIPTNPGSNDLLHYEVLLRMLDDEGEIVNPGAFLPPAERFGLIHKIDRWVIKNTLKWLSEHPQVLEKTKLCSINLSGLSLSDKDLSDYVKLYLIKYDIDCSKICFEITESSAIHNLGLAMSFMTHMHNLGCSFSLDDFGTGMSSFSYLKQLPVDHLKIDGSFIRDICTDPIDLAMARSINEIGHVMGISTIAEFVENKETLRLLKQIGVDYAQGYHIAKPTPIETLLGEVN